MKVFEPGRTHPARVHCCMSFTKQTGFFLHPSFEHVSLELVSDRQICSCKEYTSSGSDAFDPSQCIFTHSNILGG